MGRVITVSTIISCFASAELGSAWWLSACRHGPLWRLTRSWCSRQKILILIILILNNDPSSQPALYEDEGLPQLEPSLISPSRVRVPLHWICAVQNYIERNTYYNYSNIPYSVLLLSQSPYYTPPPLRPWGTLPSQFPQFKRLHFEEEKDDHHCIAENIRQGKAKHKRNLSTQCLW